MMRLSLAWRGGLHFTNAPDSPAIELQSSVPGASSPTQALAYAVMGCMAMDIVHVIQKSRQELVAMTVSFEGDRAEAPPRRFLAMRLVFDLKGAVDGHVVERAIELSRTKYCSVWHTIRPDVALATSFTIHPAP